MKISRPILITIINWIKAHKKQLLIHSLILSSFTLYSLFLAGPLFNQIETLPDEAKLVQTTIPAETNNVRYNLDRLIVSSSALEIQGWAFIDGHNNEGNHTYIVLQSTENSYTFDTFAVFTNPITAQYGRPDMNLDWSGFTTTIPLRIIENGEYVLGICILRDENAALQYSTKVIVKSNTQIKLEEMSSK